MRMKTSGRYTGCLIGAVVLLLILTLPVQSGNVKVPDWVKGVPNAPVMKPPFEKELAAGEILRVKVENGKALKASGTGKIYRFKDGKPLVGVSPASPSGGTTYLYDSYIEADEYVIYSKGGGKIKLSHGDMLEASVVEGMELRLSLKPKDITVGRFVNIDKGESQFVYSFLKSDKDVSKAPLKFRTKTLNTQGNFERFSWEVGADFIAIKVTKGRLQVKVGQPFPKEL